MEYTALASVGIASATVAAGAIPIIGWVAAALIINKYRKAKKEDLEKERMYREFIKKQQAASRKQKDNKTTELKTLFRDIEAINNQNAKSKRFGTTNC